MKAMRGLLKFTYPLLTPHANADNVLIRQDGPVRITGPVERFPELFGCFVLGVASGRGCPDPRPRL